MEKYYTKPDTMKLKLGMNFIVMTQ
ncbi:uncharacterized protein METZ01_LOCUS439795 [marine metagenome]|uniref:Uncharacterized protein n=1 Tax=marine metagenome TaxID=408172 RepID=A0A382YV02_9ZZZZ